MRIWLLSLLLLMLLGAGAAEAARHPLDPLSPQELQAAVQVLKGSGRMPEGSLFPILTLQEPSKEEVRAWRPGAPLPRRAFAVLFDRQGNATYEAVVDLSARQVLSWRSVEGAQPAVLVEEFSFPAEWVRADPRWQEAMRRRGITDWESVHLDVWAPGRVNPGQRGARLLRVLSFYRGPGNHNPYARPIEGVVALVDVNREQVVEVVDSGVVPLAESAELGESAQGRLRRVTPLLPLQPEGVNFEVRGNEVRWQKWRFRWALHPREGLVLYTVGYEDEGQVRPVLYRASLSEMIVPYGDPDSAAWSWRNAFDVGEYGVGRLATSLRAGHEVPENAMLFDAAFADDFGQPYVQPRAVALYERDVGMLWSHYDSETEHQETRRRRQLVLAFVTTIGNYDYGLAWVFDQDGRLSLEADLTGILLPKGVSAQRSGGRSGEGVERHGRMVAPYVVAPNHQHFFSYRLDFDVDGPTNALVELNNEALPPGPENPHANAFVWRETPLSSEQQARRHMDMHTQRKWRVLSTQASNALGHPTAYLLEPGHNSHPFLHPEAEPRQRAGFIDYHLWATRHREGERHAAGDYPNQGRLAEGLPRWVADDEPLTGQDLVLWYTFGITHNPRPEEWPVMPVHRTGFSLVPDGFFSRNPAMDVPATRGRSGGRR